MPSINVRHRSASGSLDASVWELDGDSLVVFVRFAGATPVGCTLSVCSARKPRVGALSLSRVDETTWKVMPARYRFGGGFWSTVTSAYDEQALLPLWPMILSHSRTEDSLVLGAL